MDSVFKKLQQTLSDFKDSVDKDLKEMRRHKAEVQQIRAQMLDDLNSGRYIRDSKRLVLSAPEIIIGNVDKSGELTDSENSLIIIRGRNIALESAGASGTIESRAAIIRQTAVDPGTDGEENVVGPVSEIVSQARSITIHSNKETGTFSTPTALPGGGGIRIHADSDLILEASVEAAKKKRRTENIIADLETIKRNHESETDRYKNVFDSLIQELENALKGHDGLTASDPSARANIQDIFEANEEFRDTAQALYATVRKYSRSISKLAEVTRQLTLLKKQKDAIATNDDYTGHPTGSNISIAAEKIDIASVDGEGNLRENPGAGVSIKANTIGLTAHEADGSLKKGGRINLSAKDVQISAIDSKGIKVDSEGRQSSGEYPSAGNVAINSKNITMQAVDYKVSDTEIKENALTKGSRFSLRVERADISTNDTDGKATGSITMNSKELSLKSMDVDKETRADQACASGSSMLLLSEKIYAGSKDKDNMSKLVQMASDTIGVFATTTLEAQQGEKKTIMQLNGGTLALSGDKTEIYGKTTVNDATEFKSEISGPKATINTVEVKNSLKSPNLSDGMATGAGGGGGHPSVRLNMEDAPTGE